MPLMYHYVNRPGLSTLPLSKVLEEHFNLMKDEFPENDGKHHPSLTLLPSTLISLAD
jgi:hypothetical protein